jgi:kynurenine formamidase
MVAHYGKAIVPGGTEFTVEDIKAVLKKQGLTLRKGDVILFNTGWLELVGKDNKQFLETEPGIGMDAAKWLADQELLLSVVTPGLLRFIPTQKVKKNFRSTNICWQKRNL